MHKFFTIKNGITNIIVGLSVIDYFKSGFLFVSKIFKEYCDGSDKACNFSALENRKRSVTLNFRFLISVLKKFFFIY